MYQKPCLGVMPPWAPPKIKHNPNFLKYGPSYLKDGIPSIPPVPPPQDWLGFAQLPSQLPSTDEVTTRKDTEFVSVTYKQWPKQSPGYIRIMLTLVYDYHLEIPSIIKEGIGHIFDHTNIQGVTISNITHPPQTMKLVEAMHRGLGLNAESSRWSFDFLIGKPDPESSVFDFDELFPPF